MGNPNYRAAKKDAFRRLRELPETLYFHNLAHTEDVLQVVKRLASEERVSKHGLLVLKTGAVYHDIGHLFGPKEHEKNGIRIARSLLPIYGYNARDIDRISGLIRATEMPQKPRTKLQRIICDADLDNFGRDDFFLKGELLRLELAEQGIEISQREWYENSLKLLEKHHYFTDSEIRLRQEGKEQNINQLKELLLIK